MPHESKGIATEWKIVIVLVIAIFAIYSVRTVLLRYDPQVLIPTVDIGGTVASSPGYTATDIIFTGHHSQPTTIRVLGEVYIAALKNGDTYNVSVTYSTANGSVTYACTETWLNLDTSNSSVVLFIPFCA